MTPPEPAMPASEMKKQILFQNVYYIIKKNIIYIYIAITNVYAVNDYQELGLNNNGNQQTNQNEKKFKLYLKNEIIQ